jgi:DNA invertase Pin-like site-specific DNA recombinase
VDRLGRSLPDLLSFMGELKAKGVDLYLHRQSLDTSTLPAVPIIVSVKGVSVKSVITVNSLRQMKV